MTTAAMVFGMLPVALGMGEGSEMRSPMGVTVIGGLITSTMLTLLVVPVFYSGLEGLKARTARLFGVQQHAIVAAGHSAADEAETVAALKAHG
jgi:HAE1 family hydrophobic/amphiphilic exporter-1